MRFNFSELRSDSGLCFLKSNFPRGRRQTVVPAVSVSLGPEDEYTFPPQTHINGPLETFFTSLLVSPLGQVPSPLYSSVEMCLVFFN